MGKWALIPSASLVVSMALILALMPVLAQGQGVDLALVPSSQTIELDGTGDLTVEVRPNGKPVAGI